MRHWWYLAIAGLACVAAALVVAGGRWTPRDTAGGGRWRIVSLAPSVTEMLFALGLEDGLVGVTDYCDYPPAAKRIERIGGFRSPNVERLLALKPDLAIASGLDRTDAVQALRGAGVGVLDLRIRNFEEMFEALRDIGRATGRLDRAAEVVAAMQADLSAVAARYAAVPVERRPRVFVEIWYNPMTTAGGASFLDDLITRAGGVNVAHDLAQEHPRVNPEQVIAWNPDVIVVCYMARGGASASAMAGRIGWADIAAVRQGRVIGDIPSDHLLRPGPRLVEGVKILSRRLYEPPGTSTDGHTCR